MINKKNKLIWKYFLMCSILFLVGLIIVCGQGLINYIWRGLFLLFSLYHFYLHLNYTKANLYAGKILTANTIKIKLDCYKIKQKDNL